MGSPCLGSPVEVFVGQAVMPGREAPRRGEGWGPGQVQLGGAVREQSCPSSSARGHSLNSHHQLLAVSPVLGMSVPNVYLLTFSQDDARLPRCQCGREVEQRAKGRW